MYYLLFLTTDDSKLRLAVTSNPKARVASIVSESGVNLQIRYSLEYETRKLAEARRDAFLEVFSDYRYTSFVIHENGDTVNYKTNWFLPEILEYLRMDKNEAREKLETCYFCSHLVSFNREEVFLQ